MNNSKFIKYYYFLRNRLQTLKIERKYKRQFLNIKEGKYSVSDIEVITIEFCSICNLHCRYCYLKKNDRPPYLDLKLYEKLLLELCSNRQYRKDIIMQWPISGCFFLHPHCREIISLTAKYKEQFPFFSPQITLNDNMMLFNKEMVDFILQQNVINQINCSLDGVNKESFEYMRPGAKFETVIKNIRYLLKKNQETGHKIVVRIHNGNDAISIKYPKDSCYNEIFRQADCVTTWKPKEWNDSFHTESAAFKPKTGFCSFVFNEVTLSTSGAITKCCLDLQELTKYGDFTNSTLESIWKSQARKDFLNLMADGKRRLLPGCNNCSIG